MKYEQKVVPLPTELGLFKNRQSREEFLKPKLVNGWEYEGVINGQVALLRREI